MSTIKSSSENLTLNADGSGNDVLIQSNGSTKAIITAESNAGLGTTSPSFEHGTGLEIRYAGGNGAHLKLTDNASGAGGTNGFDLHAFNANAYIENYEAGSLVFRNNGDERMRILAGGNVGIGTGTPARTLHVNSADANVASFEGHQGEGLVISSGTNGQIDIIGYDDGASAYNPIAIRSASAGGIFLDTTGAVTMPAQPAFMAQVASAGLANMAINNWTAVAFADERFDQNSDYANNTFTAPVTGKYQLNLQVRTDNLDTAATYYQFRLNTSNRSYNIIKDFGFGDAADVAYWTFNANILADMDANDTVSVDFLQSGGTAQSDITDNAYFSGYLAC